MTYRLPKALVYIGSLVLIVTAAFHALALPQVREAAQNKQADPLVKMFMEPLWLFPALNWLIVAIIAVFAARKLPHIPPWILLLLSLIPIADAVSLYSFIGPFIGAHMLILSGGLYCSAALLSLRRGNGVKPAPIPSQ